MPSTMSGTEYPVVVRKMKKYVGSLFLTDLSVNFYEKFSDGFEFHVRIVADT
jgi:hypothetical protein